MNNNGYINNSDLIPRLMPDGEVELEKSGKLLYCPDWVKTLIIEQVNVDSASPDGTFKGMPFVLDHLAEMGVNGIWLNPIFDGIHYYNYGPGTLRSSITGTDDVNEGWQVVKNFVDEAHKRNIRVFFDIVTWGVNPKAPLLNEHPDWFDGYSEEYKGPYYNWRNCELFEWFSERLIDIIRVTGADGYRADCNDNYCGPELYCKVRRVLHSEGKYIAIFGEQIKEGTESFFDFNEHSIDYWSVKEGTKFVDGEVNFVSDYKPDIVASVLTGRGLDTRPRQASGNAGLLRYYSSIVSCHDSRQYIAEGSLTVMGYASILSPFIPMWYIGEEWDNLYTGTEICQWLFANVIDWKQMEKNREFYESVKYLIRIRRTYPEIFEEFPLNHREINFCGVETDKENALPVYARYKDGLGIIVAGNYSDEAITYDMTVPLEKLGIDGNDYCSITDLMTGEVITEGKAKDIAKISRTVLPKDIGVYGIGKVLNNKNPFYKLFEK